MTINLTNKEARLIGEAVLREMRFLTDCSKIEPLLTKDEDPVILLMQYADILEKLTRGEG